MTVMPDVQYKNLASARILTNVYTNSTSLEVKASAGNTFPSNPDVKPFYATISDANQIANSVGCEIVKVTNATSSGSNIEFTIERAQRNTTAKNFEADKAILTHAIYTEDVVEPLQDAAYVGSVLSTPSSVAYVATDNIQPSAVTTAKIANGAVTSDKIECATYSTTEKSIGTWTDGKTVYRRVFKFNNVTAVGEARTTQNFGYHLIDTLVAVSGNILNTSNSVQTALGTPWLANAGGYTLENGIVIDSEGTGQLHFRPSSNGTFNITIVCDYTKL